MDTPQEPRWLDAEESQAWRALAKTLERLPAALDAQLRRDAGISHFEYQVLALLSEAPGRTLRMSVLATLAEGSLPRLSQVVARLEQRGWSAAPPTRRRPLPCDPDRPARRRCGPRPRPAMSRRSAAWSSTR